MSQNADVIDKVRTSFTENHRLTVREIADEVGISRGSENTILTKNLGMRSVVAKSVPMLLLPEQQQLRHEVERRTYWSAPIGTLSS
jgi:hypothetical protein